jgi:hypothetical protein
MSLVEGGIRQTSRVLTITPPFVFSAANMWSALAHACNMLCISSGGRVKSDIQTRGQQAEVQAREARSKGKKSLRDFP